MDHLPFAVIYTRVSTKSQLEGTSMEMQAQESIEWAEANGYQIREVCEDRAIAGYQIFNRPGIQRAISLLQKDDILVVRSQDRLSRCCRDTLMILDVIKRKGAKIHSIQEPELGRDTQISIIKTITRVIKLEIEHENKAQLLPSIMGLKATRTPPRVLGKWTYGRMLNEEKTEYVEDPHTQSILCLIMALYKRLNKNGNSECYKSITEMLNEYEVDPSPNVRWTAARVEKIITDENTDFNWSISRDIPHAEFCEGHFANKKSLIIKLYQYHIDVGTFVRDYENETFDTERISYDMMHEIIPDHMAFKVIFGTDIEEKLEGAPRLNEMNIRMEKSRADRQKRKMDAKICSKAMISDMQEKELERREEELKQREDFLLRCQLIEQAKRVEQAEQEKRIQHIREIGIKLVEERVQMVEERRILKKEYEAALLKQQQEKEEAKKDAKLKAKLQQQKLALLTRPRPKSMTRQIIPLPKPQ